MKSLLAILSLISTVALAETGTFTVEGMHCGGCKKMVSKNVCNNPELKDKFESCEVTLTDAKKQLGQIVIISKEGSKIDAEAVKAGVKKAGDDYHVTKEEVK